jgi:hypothetical protein
MIPSPAIPIPALIALRDEIAAHCASFFWNDTDYGMLHARWRDELSALLTVLERQQEQEKKDVLTRIGQASEATDGAATASTDTKG